MFQFIPTCISATLANCKSIAAHHSSSLLLSPEYCSKHISAAEDAPRCTALAPIGVLAASPAGGARAALERADDVWGHPAAIKLPLLHQQVWFSHERAAASSGAALAAADYRSDPRLSRAGASRAMPLGCGMAQAAPKHAHQVNCPPLLAPAAAPAPRPPSTPGVGGRRRPASQQWCGRRGWATRSSMPRAAVRCLPARPAAGRPSSRRCPSTRKRWCRLLTDERSVMAVGDSGRM